MKGGLAALLALLLAMGWASAVFAAEGDGRTLVV